jgi:hypothetical protein
MAIPLLITTIIGLIFGPKQAERGLGQIRFAIVDEDNSALTRLLHGGLNQREFKEHFDPVFLERAEAMKQVQAGKLSAMLLIPRGFTRGYLTSTNAVTLELMKNPAESIHPAVLEELLEVLVTGMDAIKRQFGSELPEWQAVLDGPGDYHRVSELIVRAGDKVEAARKMLFPPRVTYNKGRAAEKVAASGSSGSSGPKFNIFGFLLPGLAAMFLLFLGENATRDLHRELEQRTVQRFQTLHPYLYQFVASKLLFCLVFLLLSSAVMLGGGGLIFRFAWHDPLAIVLLTMAYCLFASGLMTLFPALISDSRGAQVLASMTAMVMGLAGGGTFPARQLPAFLREHICPLLPNYWYTEAVRSLNFEPHPGGWIGVCLRMSVVGLVFMIVAAVLLQRSLERGRTE